MSRYPHIAQIILSTETDNDGDGITAVGNNPIDLNGRFEMKSRSEQLNYSAKFYCKPVALEPFEADGEKFIYEGKQFVIKHLKNYSNHCEIWLE